MKLFLSSLLLVGFALFLFACNTKSAQDGNAKNYSLVEFDAPFKFSQKKGVQLLNDDLKIQFAEVVEDSRCPEGTTCVWEGEVKVRLNVESGGKMQNVELKMRGKQKENAVAKLNGYTFYLSNVSPYPKENEKIEAADYKLTMVVKK